MPLLTSLQIYQEFLRNHIKDYKENSAIYEQYLKEYYALGRSPSSKCITDTQINIKKNSQEIMKANKELEIITDKINFILKVRENENHLKEHNEILKLLKKSIETQQKHLIAVSVISVISIMMNIFNLSF
uniref:Uncharacterized protein n=1 Tax=viral metagenome TaxID=1070528 RepID=A0A6C0CDU3_9ZZZZ